MRWSDSHCHSTGSLPPELWGELSASGCQLLVQGGIDPQEWEAQRQLLDRSEPRILPVYGLHPWFVAEASEAILEEAFVRLSSWAPEASGLGEMGLDPLRSPSPESYARQRDFFVRQLQLAQQLQKPCVFHIVRAYPEAWTLIARHAPSGRGLLHSFWAPQAWAKPFLDAGYVLSLPPRIQKGDPHGILSYAPRAQIVFESDSPQAQGTKPVSTPFAAQQSLFHAAKAWGEDPELVAERQLSTLQTLFGLPVF
jgi:TatD DNase family protein